MSKEPYNKENFEIIDFLEVCIDDLYQDTGKNVKTEYKKNILPKLKSLEKKFDRYYKHEIKNIINTNLNFDNVEIDKILNGIVPRYLIVRGYKRLNKRNFHIMSFNKISYDAFVNTPIFINIYNQIITDLKMFVSSTSEYVLSWMDRKKFSKENINNIKGLFDQKKIPCLDFDFHLGDMISKHLQTKYEYEKIIFYFNNNDNYCDEYMDRNNYSEEYRRNSELIVPLIDLLKNNYNEKTTMIHEIHNRLKSIIRPNSNCPLLDTIEKWRKDGKKATAEPKSIFALIESFNNKIDKKIFKVFMKNDSIKIFYDKFYDKYIKYMRKK
jgi:hypothetical protein